MADYEFGVNASPHRIGSLMWAMDRSIAVRVVVAALAAAVGLLASIAVS